jgi:hypothetical protein
MKTDCSPENLEQSKDLPSYHSTPNQKSWKSRSRDRNERHTSWKERIILYIFADHIIVYVENLRVYTRKERS